MNFEEYQLTICRTCSRKMGIGRYDAKRAYPQSHICLDCWNETQKVSLSESYPSVPNVDPSSFIAGERSAVQSPVLPDRARRVHASKGEAA